MIHKEIPFPKMFKLELISLLSDTLKEASDNACASKIHVGIANLRSVIIF